MTANQAKTLNPVHFSIRQAVEKVVVYSADVPADVLSGGKQDVLDWLKEHGETWREVECVDENTTEVYYETIKLEEDYRNG